jgi:hypothetical protein
MSRRPAAGDYRSCSRILVKLNLPKAERKELFAIVQSAKGDVTDRRKAPGP